MLSDVWDTRPFVFKEIDIVKQDAKGWRDLYDLDVPVVRVQWPQADLTEPRLTRSCQIHISKATAPEEQPGQASSAVKLMHRFTVDEVNSKMDQVERS